MYSMHTANCTYTYISNGQCWNLKLYEINTILSDAILLVTINVLIGMHKVLYF